jgi:hypothetical protein
MHASAAAILEGNPDDFVATPRGGGSGGGVGVCGNGSGAGGGDVGSKESAMVLLDEIAQLFVK